MYDRRVQAQTTGRVQALGRARRPRGYAVGEDPCPEGLVRSWDPPHDCVPISAGRRALGVVVVVSAVALLGALFAAGLWLGTARGFP